MSLVLKIRGLSKKFLEVNQKDGQSQLGQSVLKNICFDARKGEVIAILGPSGSGKSTLLRCINFLETPTFGSITVDGKTISMDRGHLSKGDKQQIIGFRKKIAMVFQHFNLWSHLTVLENIIEAPVVVLKQDKNKAIEKAYGLLEKVGLSDFAKFYPAQLSGGQKQRVAIARALAMDPEIILFDEPTSALDPELVQEVLKVINELKQDGLTMLIVSHEIQFSKDVSDKIIFLYEGLVEETGNTSEVFATPKSPRFQQFLSSLNLR